FKQIGKELLDRHVLFDITADDLVEPRADTPASQRPFLRPLIEKPLSALPADRSTFTALQTVRVSASRPAKNDRKEITLHFVNYNRDEPAQKHSAGTGIIDEKPIAARGVAAVLRLPAGMRVAKVVAVSPESPEPKECKFTLATGRVRFELP